jgi:hypothetical protein
LHILRPFEPDLRIEHVKGRTPDDFDFQVVGEHGHRFDHVFDDDALLTVLGGLPQSFDVESAQERGHLLESGFQVRLCPDLLTQCDGLVARCFNGGC